MKKTETSRKMNSNFLEVLFEDLEYLRTEWNENLNDGGIRRGSVILRKLLVENDLIRAWKLLGFEQQPKIRAPYFSKTVNYPEGIGIKLAAATGVKRSHKYVADSTGQMKFAFSREIDLSTDGADRGILSQFSQALLCETEMPLSEFRDSTCVIVDNKNISRRMLIKYICNKKGGVHFDSHRNPDKNDELLFKLLDSVPENEFTQSRADPPHRFLFFTLLGTGLCLAKSTDVSSIFEKLRQTADNSLPE